MMLRLIAIAALGTSLAACAATPGESSFGVAQEQRTCANTGLEPGTAPFQTCVGNLDATIRQDANISGG